MPGQRATTPDHRDVATAAHQAFWLLRIGFTVAPILFGIDKFLKPVVNVPRWPDDAIACRQRSEHAGRRPKERRKSSNQAVDRSERCASG